MNGAGIDGSWYVDVNHFAQYTPWLHAILVSYTTYGFIVFGVLIVAAWWLARRNEPRAMAAALWAPFAVVIAYLLSVVIKSSLTELRPCRAIGGVVTLVKCPGITDYSFPSNHAVITAAAAVAVLLVNRRLGIAAIVLSLIMGFSRVYVGAHYPHDVVAGWILGALVGYCGIFVSRRLTVPVATLRSGRLAPLLCSVPR